jgi:hypothetical protein
MLDVNLQADRNSQTFRKNVLLPSSGSKSDLSNQPITASNKQEMVVSRSVCCLLFAGFLFGLRYEAEDGGGVFL